MSETPDLASMPLYVNVERIDRDLAELGIGDNDPLTPAQLFPFDQYHYHGTDAVQAAAQLLGLGPTHHVLEVGAGLGGPARYLAHAVGCRVTALELQPTLHTVAARLTGRCGLGRLVTHRCGNALCTDFPEATFDAVVSWLALHHIPERPRLLRRLVRTLRPGGQCYLEDFYQRAPFAAADLPDVRHTIFGRTLTSLADYTRNLRQAGCTAVTAIDLTEDWRAFCTARLAAWQAQCTRHIRVYGEPTYARLEAFYTVVQRLFASGSLGGACLMARVASTS